MLLLIASFVALAATSPAFAQTDLYGPEAPRDVAYIRVVNATPDGEAHVTLAGEEWEALPFAGVSAYHPVAPGQHVLQAGEEQVTIEAGPESFVTVALLADGPLVLHDTPLQDISRGLLTFYNLTSEGPLTLATADGTEVMTAVEPGSAESIAISEAEAALTVLQDGETLATLEPRLYRRGEAHAVIVLPLGSDPQLIYATADAEP